MSEESRKRNNQTCSDEFTAQCFLKYIHDEELLLSIIETPVLEEGVLKCRKCKSRKIYSAARQVRGGDEPMTVFATCSNCGSKWTE